MCSILAYREHINVYYLYSVVVRTYHGSLRLVCHKIFTIFHLVEFLEVKALEHQYILTM